MRVAQELYEGIEIGKGVLAGLITYMRTDSVVVSSQAIRTLRDYIKDNFGEEYVPKVARLYRSKKGAQEAHEAIRPTDVYNTPVSLKEYLTQEQFKLYELIWKRFVASQMEAARFLNTSVDIQAGYYLFKASGLELLFPGFLRLYPSQEEEGKLPAGLKEGLRLWLVRLLPSQHFTKPPPRFSEATLIRSLEDNGIGRPSTYAPTIQTLLIRGYVRSHQGYLQSSDLGITVCDMLVNNFSRIMDIRFTAQMEGRLDEVEEGRVPWSLVVKDFYLPFKENLELATQRIQKEVTPTEQVCSVCGKPMVIKWGRKGKFLSCSDFPRCKNALPITTGVKCPQPGCNGELVMRRSRRGSFYGCTNFPRCRYIATSLPQNS
jgi:DNA topoisomerase-1